MSFARHRMRLTSWAVGWALTAVSAAALAQPAKPPAAEAPRVLVIGERAATASAEARKRAASDLIDAVDASALAPLPDLSVGDALQRITGVQVARDRGEASAFSVRGLGQVETTLNGREVFTAGAGRTLDLADIPADLLASLEARKTASADQLEGGLGGLVALRTRHPFDWAGDQTRLSTRLIHGEAAGRSAWQGSALMSRRIGLGAAGELGLLLDLSLQDRAWREDQKSIGNPTVRADLLPGRPVVVPNGSSESLSQGTRRRQAMGLVAAWRPDPATDIQAEAHFSRLETRQDTYQVNLAAGARAVPGSLALFDGTSDLRRITWVDAPLTVLSFARDTVTQLRQLALSGRQQRGALELRADLSHTHSRNELFFAGPILSGRAALYAQDLSGRVPSTTLTDPSLADPAAYRYSGLSYRVRPFTGSLDAARLDAQWALDHPVLERLSLGWRGALRRADNAPGLAFGDVSLNGPAATALPGLLRERPGGPLLDGRGASVGGVLVNELAGARDAAGWRALLGVPGPLPGAGSPLGVWQLRERSDALYVRLDWQTATHALDGHAGLRLVHTRLRVDGSRSQPGGAGLVPTDVQEAGADWLPSAALRWRPNPGLQLRAAVSRTMTRPNFDQLSPSLTLLQNSINPALNTGAAGNPALRPLRARNLDLAIESGAGQAPAWSATLFLKQVDGFIANASQPETWDGVVYQVNRPYNSDPARVRGLELAASHFVDAPSRPWHGVGVLANYTHVDSRTPDRRVGRELPLQNLSRHSANLVGLYEPGPWGARLAWNWRSRFLSGVSSVVGVGNQPVYTRGSQWLDGTLSWRIDRRSVLSLEGSNLLRTLRSTYTAVDTRTQSALTNDRQWALRLSIAL